MKPSLQLNLGQHLAMTPQLQQAIRLLQLSTIELSLEVQQALESNPMLEQVEDGDGQREENPELQATGESTDGAPEVADASETEVPGSDGEIPNELPTDSDWEDVYDGAMLTSSSGPAGNQEFELQRSAYQSLRDHLMWQMRLTPLSDRDVSIATAIIDSINEDGYLVGNLDDIRLGLPDEDMVELDEMEAVLCQIQNFDPLGIGARNPGECLYVQLRHLDPGTPWLDKARELVKDHLDLLAGNDTALLKRRLKVTDGELDAIVQLIRSLNPRPGSTIETTPPNYITPDVFVNRKKGKWVVELNPESIPRLRINSQYAGMVRRADTSDANTYLRNNLQEARWFLKSLQSRNDTLLKVARSIVKFQQQFFEHGPEAMKPLVLRHIAEQVGMHESTISRVTTQKYMHTPRGLFEFKYFFSSFVNTAAGGECSSTAIRALIRKLVAAEVPAKPLSDSKISTILSDQGIHVARRTVAKYREAMTIPSSSERKRLL